MAANIVLGAQWGDEGKGKMTDYLAEEANVVVRFQGGNNAGHTVEVGENQYKLHLIPSGILHDDKLNVLGNGVVIDPKALFTEIDYLENLGIKVSPEKLAISDRANIIMPYHRELDRLKEIARGKDSIGTTGKGIGPCYTDKIERSGIRVCDILQPEVLREKLQNTLEIKNKLIKNVYGGEELDFNKVYEEYVEFGKKMKPFVKETSVIVYDAIKGDKNVLFEGAQGTLLDIDYGTYPYVTSSNTTAGGVCNGTGVGPTLIQNALGIAKAYTTRVGKGPFPTELTGEMGEHIRTVGHEYGVTTGRSRRCGWLDLVIVKSAVRISGLTSLAITKIDTIAGIDKIKICVGYKLGDEVIDYFPASLQDLAQCEPVYIEMDGWDDSVAYARSFDELHENAKAYIRKIEEIAGVKISIVSVGPKRSQTIRVHEEL